MNKRAKTVIGLIGAAAFTAASVLFTPAAQVDSQTPVVQLHVEQTTSFAWQFWLESGNQPNCLASSPHAKLLGTDFCGTQHFYGDNHPPTPTVAP